jgi:hypothetical protein
MERKLRPKVGEKVVTPKGTAFISRTIPYGEVIEEMKKNGLSRKEIAQFNIRVEHFLGKKNRYFECELTFPNGETTRIDWSDLLFLKAYHDRQS